MRGSSARVQLLLGVEVLEDRFDDDVGVGARRRLRRPRVRRARARRRFLPDP